MTTSVRVIRRSRARVRSRDDARRVLSIESRGPDASVGQRKVHFMGAGTRERDDDATARARAVRRWLPCLDAPRHRAPIQLELTCVPGTVAFISGDVDGPQSLGGAEGEPARLFWRAALTYRARASQLGFVVGYASALRACPHPTLSGVTLCLGTTDVDADAPRPIEGVGHASVRLWPQLLFLARKLPALLDHLNGDLGVHANLLHSLERGDLALRAGDIGKLRRRVQLVDELRRRGAHSGPALCGGPMRERLAGGTAKEMMVRKTVPKRKAGGICNAPGACTN